MNKAVKGPDELEKLERLLFEIGHILHSSWHERGVDCMARRGDIKVEKALPNDYLKEAFSTFKLENSHLKIGFSRFASLRPKNVLLVKDSPVDQCKCSIHENFKPKLKGLNIRMKKKAYKG